MSGTWESGSSVAILFSAQANLFAGGRQTSVFSGSLEVDEQSLAINATGLSAAAYVFSDQDGDGFSESYDNTTPIFSEAQIEVGEEFCLEIFVNASIFSDGTVTMPSDSDPPVKQDFANTFRVDLVLPPDVSFVPVPEPGLGWLTALALLPLAGLASRGARSESC